MRFILPVMAAPPALSVGVSPARQQHQTSTHHAPAQSGSRPTSRCTSPGTPCWPANGVTVRGKVRPGGGHRVKVVFGGPDGEVLPCDTKANGTFRLQLGAGPRSATTRCAPSASTTAAGARLGQRGPAPDRLPPRRRLLLRPRPLRQRRRLRRHPAPGTLGVANKTLPCGTMVKLRYHGHSITVPVIDRGPYVAGRDYDLTEATKERLGFPGVGTCWPTTSRLRPRRSRAGAGGSASAALGVRVASKEARRTPSRRTGRGGS